MPNRQARAQAIVFALGVFAAAQAHAGWKIVDLGPQAARDVGSTGVVVGNDGNAGTFDASGFSILGTLPNSGGSDALGVNTAGVIVGYTLTLQPDDSEHAFPVAWTNRVPTQLPLLSAAYCCGTAAAINDAGTIVGTDTGGFGQGPGGSSMAFRYAGGAVTALGALGGGNVSEALAINASGEIVGTSGNNDGIGCPDCVAFLYRDGVMSALPLLPGTHTSVANAIDDAGDIVGNAASDDAAFPVAFVYRQGVMAPLKLPPGADTSTATGINNRGQIVGTAGATRNGSLRRQDGYLYQNGRYTDLSTLAAVVAAGFTNLVPFKINDAGVIVGTGTVGGLPHAFMLQPTGR